MADAEIDISALSRKLADAVTKDSSPITPDRIVRLFHDNAHEANVGDLLCWRGQGTLFAPPMVLHFVYESWLQDIGTCVGFLPEEDMPPDGWINQRAPKAIEIKKVLARLAIAGRAQIQQLAEVGEDDLTVLPVLRTSTYTREALQRINTRQPVTPVIRRPVD